MRDFIERTFNARVTRWAEPDGDGGEVFEAVSARGVLVRADSLHLLVNALREPLTPPHAPLRLVGWSANACLVAPLAA